MAIQLSELLSLVYDEDNFQVGLVARDVATLDLHINVLDMSARREQIVCSPPPLVTRLATNVTADFRYRKVCI